MDKLFCKQKPLLKNAYATLFLLCKNKYFFGKAFFLKERFVDITGIFEGEEAKRKGFYYKNL
jgi:hypothetical protein